MANVIPGNKSKNNSTFNLLDEKSQALSKNVATNYVNNLFAIIGQRLATNIDYPSEADLLSMGNILREDFLHLPRVQITSFSVNPLRARNALRQHFRVILYTLESAS